MKVLVCGGRQFGNCNVEGKPESEINRERLCIADTLNALHEQSPITVLIHGGAPGADTVASQWAAVRGIAIDPYRVDQMAWRQYGRAAGPMRNARMLAMGAPDLVVAFPGNRGTADMIRRAKKAGVKVLEVTL